MNSLQLLNFVRPTSNSMAKRYAFSQKDRIKLLNHQNKSLYGPVIKTKPSKLSTLKLTKKPSIVHDATTPDAASLKKPETNYGSEMHWIVGNKWNEILDVNGISKETKVSQVILTSRTKTSAKENNSEYEPEKSVATSAKENNSECETEKSVIAETGVIDSNRSAVVHRPILLSNEELNNVLKHPLKSEILQAPPTHIRAPTLRNVPSVGKVLQYTMPEAARSALLNWKLTKIRELGEQGFAELQQTNLNSGITFHWSLQHYFLTKEIPLASTSVYKLWESVRGVLDTFSAMPVLVERPLFHPTLKYKGICDCVSEVDNQLTIIEWKKSGRSKPTLDATYDAPLQLSAYLGAINSIPEFQGRIRQGMVVVAYENGQQADVYKMNEIMLRKYWRIWLGRLHEFWIRSRDGTLLEPI